jgi:hypothetical protein
VPIKGNLPQGPAANLFGFFAAVVAQLFRASSGPPHQIEPPTIITILGHRPGAWRPFGRVVLHGRQNLPEKSLISPFQWVTSRAAASGTEEGRATIANNVFKAMGDERILLDENGQAKMISRSSTKHSQRSLQCHPKRSTNKQKKSERLL